MNQQATTGTGSSDMFVMKWVKETQVEALVHASDNFNLLVAIALGFLAAAAAAAAGIALGAGALHPLIIYLILTGCASCGLFASIMALRENGNVKTVRRTLREETESYYVPSPFKQFNLSTGANESPSLTVGRTGISAEVGSNEAQSILVGNSQDAESGLDASEE